MHLSIGQVNLILSLALAIGIPAALAQVGPVEPSRLQAAMTNADVINLTAAGIDADIILSKIRSAQSTAFDTSVDALKALKAAGVANDVILNMVTGRAIPPPNASDKAAAAIDMSHFKEPVLKEGLWEERTTMTMHPGDTPSEDTRFSCHSHAHDHADFQNLRNGGVESRGHGGSGRGLHVSGDNDPEVRCAIIRAGAEDEKQIVEQRCQTHGITMTMKMSWEMIDEQHMRSEAAMSYSPPVQGMSNVATVTELTYKGPCPSGVEPGETVDDEAPAYQKKSKKDH